MKPRPNKHTEVQTPAALSTETRRRSTKVNQESPRGTKEGRRSPAREHSQQGADSPTNQATKLETSGVKHLTVHRRVEGSMTKHRIPATTKQRAEPLSQDRQGPLHKGSKIAQGSAERMWKVTKCRAQKMHGIRNQL